MQTHKQKERPYRNRFLSQILNREQFCLTAGFVEQEEARTTVSIGGDGVGSIV